MITRRVRTAVAIAAIAALSACTATAPGTAVPTVTAHVPQPAGVLDPAPPAPAASGGSTGNCDATASLRPVGSLPAPGAMPVGSTMAKIQQRGQLIVGVDQNTYDWGFLDPATGQIVGFDIDIARAVANAIFGDDKHIKFVAITAAQRIPDVMDGTVDLVADTMTINCTRLQQVAFSSVYYQAGQQVLVLKDSTVTGIGDLGGKKVCAATGSTSIANIAAATPRPVPVAVNDWTDCLVLLQQGQIDAVSTDNAILAGMVAQDPATKIVGATFTSEPYGMAMSRKAPDFVRFVNGVLEQMRTDGEWVAIYHKWLPGTQSPPVARYRD